MKANELIVLSPKPLQRAERAFTLIELLVVISIMAILAGMIVGLAPVANNRIRESRLRAELTRLTMSIDAYKAKYGVYPPDNVLDSIRGTVDPVTNQLYFELTGVIVSNKIPDGGYFYPASESGDGPSQLTPKQVEDWFHRDGFVNAATEAQRRRLFQHPFRESEYVQISTNPLIRVLVAPVPWPKRTSYQIKDPVTGQNVPVDYPAPLGTNFATLNPWRYVSSNPTNNPTSYDLWCEYIVRGQRKVVGNWKQ